MYIDLFLIITALACVPIFVILCIIKLCNEQWISTEKDNIIHVNLEN